MLPTFSFPCFPLAGSFAPVRLVLIPSPINGGPRRANVCYSCSCVNQINFSVPLPPPPLPAALYLFYFYFLSWLLVGDTRACKYSADSYRCIVMSHSCRISQFFLKTDHEIHSSDTTRRGVLG